MGMTLAELQEWPPHIKALADAASKRGDASQQAADKVQAIVDMSTWQGDTGDAARDAMKRSAARFDNAGFEALYVAMHANKAYGESQHWPMTSGPSWRTPQLPRRWTSIPKPML